MPIIQETLSKDPLYGPSCVNRQLREGDCLNIKKGTMASHPDLIVHRLLVRNKSVILGTEDKGNHKVQTLVYECDKLPVITSNRVIIPDIWEKSTTYRYHP
jgi:hypothetical protein